MLCDREEIYIIFENSHCNRQWSLLKIMLIEFGKLKTVSKRELADFNGEFYTLQILEIWWFGNGSFTACVNYFMMKQKLSKCPQLITLLLLFSQSISLWLTALYTIIYVMSVMCFLQYIRYVFITSFLKSLRFNSSIQYGFLNIFLQYNTVSFNISLMYYGLILSFFNSKGFFYLSGSLSSS